MKCMANDCGINLTVLKVDGGMTINNFFLQMQSDLLATKVCKLLNFTFYTLHILPPAFLFTGRNFHKFYKF